MIFAGTAFLGKEISSSTMVEDLVQAACILSRLWIGRTNGSEEKDIVGLEVTSMQSCRNKHSARRIAILM